MCQPRTEGVEWDSAHTEGVEWDSTHTEKVPYETQVSLRQQILTHHKCLFGVRIKLVIFSVQSKDLSQAFWPGAGYNLACGWLARSVRMSTRDWDRLVKN